MKKNLSYREKLLELSKIYKISEVNSYIRNKKYLTTPQIEHILKKNKVPIPTEINKSLLEIQVKKISRPVYSTGNKINNFFGDVWSFSIKLVFKFFKSILNFLFSISKMFFKTCSFISKTTINFLNSIYNISIEEKKANKILTGLIAFSFVSVVALGAFYNKDFFKYYAINNFLTEKFTGKTLEKETKDQNFIKKEENQKKLSAPKEKPKKEKSLASVPKTKKKKDKKVDKEVSEFVLPNLNLKTETVLSLFKDVQYDLRRVRNEKRVKPIYFTQFPKDLDEIKDSRLKKETFIKIVLPLVVAENEKILDDRYKLKKILSRRNTSDKEKAWLRQKLREYKVKNSDMKELSDRMDIIPISIALAQAAKESGWGTSRFALEGNAIFGQWTWTGQGIEPLDKGKHEGHKILRFPILRASVKAYKNNLNTHRGYSDFRKKRASLRKRKKSIEGLSLTDTLDKYAKTGKEYTKILEQIIVQNSLEDFENVLLSNSVKRKELNL